MIETGAANRVEAEKMYLIRFSVGSQEFGLGIEQVVEVVRLGSMVKSSETQGGMAGTVHFGEEDVPIVDLRERLGLPRVPRTPRSRVIVVRIHDDLVGMIVDSTHQLTQLSSFVIGPPPPAGRAASKSFVKATADLGGRPVDVLDVDKVLSRDELTMLRNAAHDQKSLWSSGLSA